MGIGQDPLVNRTPERTLVLALAALATALHAGLVLGSDAAALLTTWVPDDAFYYLQPAWNAASGLGFSFDGVEPTYGFQPLWALILTLLGQVVGGKAALVPTALLVGGALHVAAGVLLFAWFERAGLARGGVVAAGLWLLNPNVVQMQATAMESGLVALLLLVTLLLLPVQGRGLALGFALGLLVLARVSLFPAVLFVIGWLLWTRRPPRIIAGVLAGVALVCLPWLLYATFALGQPLPASMDRKLVAGLAGGGRFIADLPLVPDGLVRALLPAGERELFDAPGLIGPTWERLWLFGVRAPIGWALGAWLPARLGAGAAVLLAGWVVLAVRLRGAPGRLKAPVGIAFLVLLAVENAGANNLLLSQYVEYGYWYRVPEVLGIVTLVGLAAARAFGPGRALTIPLRLLGVSVLLVGLIGAAGALRPRAHEPSSPAMARGAFDVARAMSERLPPGARVGSWNAGLIGWVVDGPVVVNLDGLANRPDFVPVAAQEVLFRHGIEDRLTLLDWLEQSGVEYLVDLQPVDGPEEPFYGVVPPDRVTLVLRSTPVRHWSLVDRDYAVTLVRLTPAAIPAGSVSPPSAAPPR